MAKNTTTASAGLFPYPEAAILTEGKAVETWTNFIAKEGKEDLEHGAVIELPSGTRLALGIYTGVRELEERFSRGPLGAVVVDCRGPGESEGFMSTLAGRVLPGLLTGFGTGRAPSRNSIFAVLPKNEDTAHHAYAAGTLQLGGIFVDPVDPWQVLESVSKMAAPADPGKIALCLAGGGIEGMFYELGVLRALDAHLSGRRLVDIDIFSGISAGAVLGAFLANGVHPSEIADALHGRQSRIAPVTRSILFDPNLGEVVRRLMGGVGDIMRGKWLTSPVDTAMKVTPTALFSGDKMRSYLEKELSKPGLTDDFRRLAKRLFVGATDQDTGAHVSFGTEGNEDVTISHSVRASTAMTPYYAPEKIGDRFFVDGIFTRTIDLDVAAAHGARLVICVDPLTPVQVQEAGYVHGKGGFFNTVQSVKSMIRTRFSEVIERVEEAYPDLKVLVFSPTPKDLEKMSGTLMRFFYRTETEEMAYDSTVERIEKDYDWLAADFARYGFNLSRKAVV